ncbi:MAG: hypothetical protein K6E98_06480 [Lachnospiraceae bacterium]|nr:hypothetical protein [Lachnospiraceae bacterium]
MNYNNENEGRISYRDDPVPAKWGQEMEPNLRMPGQSISNQNMSDQDMFSEKRQGERMPNQGINPQMPGMSVQNGMNRRMNPQMQGMPIQNGVNQRMNPGMQGMPMQNGMNQRMNPGMQGMPIQNGMNQRMNPKMQGVPVQDGMNQRVNPKMQGISDKRNPNPGDDPEHLSSGRLMSRLRNEEKKGSRGNDYSGRYDKRKVNNPNNLFGNDREDSGRERNGVLSANIMEGLTGYSAIVYSGILLLCLFIALLAYGKTHKSSEREYNIPTDMVTYNGLFKNIYENAVAGGLKKSASNMYNEDGTEVPAAPTAIGEQPVTEGSSGENGLSEASTDTADNTDSKGQTSGATMVLDNGSESSEYSRAESYKELLSQLEKAIASGDTDFVGTKLAYEDDQGNLKGYPQSVVDHFVTYMSTNSEKRTALLEEFSDDKYSAQNEGVFLVKLPYIKFVVNMGYDDTTISLPGFSDQVVNAGQSADIAPLLPCMYTLTISNPAWSEPVTRDIEANVNESTISINIKP